MLLLGGGEGVGTSIFRSMIKEGKFINQKMIKEGNIILYMDSDGGEKFLKGQIPPNPLVNAP